MIEKITRIYTCRYMYIVLSVLVVSNSPEQLVMPQWYEMNVVSCVKDLGIQGETVSPFSPETQLSLRVVCCKVSYIAT